MMKDYDHTIDWINAALPFLLAFLLLVSGCGFGAPYRPAVQKTFGDIEPSHIYRKTIGVLALVNATFFTDNQIGEPFMEHFLSALKSADSNAHFLFSDDVQNAPFLSEPPRDGAGQIDSFNLCAQARQEGLNAIVQPIIMDIRADKKVIGFWFWRKLHHWAEIQATARTYDTTTGASLSFEIIEERIDISEQQYQAISAGQEISLDDLVDDIKDMGEALGEKMGQIIRETPWTATVISTDNGLCEIPAGEEVGIAPGDLLTVLDTHGTLTGLDGQRYIVPWNKIGQLKVARVTARKAFAAPESGELPPVGSIVALD